MPAARGRSGHPGRPRGARPSTSGVRYTARMIAVLSPAKSLDFDSPPATTRTTRPRLEDASGELVSLMAAKTAPELARLMSLSPALAELNAHRYAGWDDAAGDERAAIVAFDGDVYRGMDAPATFTTRDYTHAQKTLRILSGLFGVLRPLDAIRPYRLEMGTRLRTPRGDTLYAYWGDRLTDVLRHDVDESPGADVLVNLASKEYFGAVHPDALGRRVVSPVFLDRKGDAPPKVISFNAKRARGAMAGWMVRERIARPSQLTGFEGLGYRFDPQLSEPDAPAFVRSHAAP